MDGNLQTEPKFIGFLSQLLLLFQFCHSCKVDNPLVETKAVGSDGVVTVTCNNPKCTQKILTWHTQPLMPGRKKARAGNFMMCMSTLLGGGSFTKVRQMCLHMGLGCVLHSTYFHYQRVSTITGIERSIIGGEGGGEGSYLYIHVHIPYMLLNPWEVVTHHPYNI